MQICEAFTYLHNQPTPIIYRDMKPANIMLQPDGQLMMIDFGTARTQKVGVVMQADTICIGTEGFAAPEQYGGRGQSDARTDIFCLGSTLYNIVTGHNPSIPPIGIHPLGQFNPSLAGSPLEEIITKCTRNDPNERYQTAAELYEDLKQASLGTYQSVNKRGKTMTFGTLRKNSSFRKQDNQGNGIITSGLSGLLQRSLDTTQQIQETVTQHQNAAANTQTQGTSGWNQVNYQVSQDYTHYQDINQQQNGTMPKSVLLGLLITLVFLLLAVILAVIKSYTAAVAVMIFALAAAVITLVFLIQSRNGNL
jgi:serine/threonine protein kinase